MTDDGRVVTWKMAIITGAMTLVTSSAGYVSSHWGGTTQDQLKESAAKLEEKLGSRIDLASAKVSDEIKKYVDEKVESTLQLTRPSKRKGRRADQ